MHSELSRLFEQYPLSSEWTKPELFQDRLSIDSFQMVCAGLVSNHQAGMSITGSAASRDGQPLTRAYFELIERTSVIEAERKSRSEYEMRSISGDPARSLNREILFPQSSDPERWRYAKSNGVAAQLTWELACRAAAFELIERDRILRSWFGEIRPERIAPSHPHGGPSPLLHPDLHIHYEFESYRIGVPCITAALGEVVVVAVIGIPRRPGIPRIGGFAARSSQGEALFSATAECLQALSFLWGEAVPEQPPAISPSPDFHQELFLTPTGIERLRRWLGGKHQRYARASGEAVTTPLSFLDITPPQLVSKLYVVKAYSPTLLPLTFGLCRKYAPDGFPEELLIHPVA